eukprot:533817-Rhodomonas_salina.2
MFCAGRCEDWEEKSSEPIAIKACLNMCKDRGNRVRSGEGEKQRGRKGYVGPIVHRKVHCIPTIPCRSDKRQGLATGIQWLFGVSAAEFKGLLRKAGGKRPP